MDVQRTVQKKIPPEVGESYLGPYQKDPCGGRTNLNKGLLTGKNSPSYCLLTVARFGFSAPNADLVCVYSVTRGQMTLRKTYSYGMNWYQSQYLDLGGKYLLLKEQFGKAN